MFASRPALSRMEYFQIEDRFGRRPHAQLIANLKDEGAKPAILSPSQVMRHIALEIKNEGRGLARFPAVRVQRMSRISIPNNALRGPIPIWPISEANEKWISVRGGANDVIYPGETLRIATLIQAGDRLDQQSPPNFMHTGHWRFHEIVIPTECVCDGMTSYAQSFTIPTLEWGGTIGSIPGASGV